MAVSVFISYSHHDRALREELEKHLANLKRQNVITSWYDGDISPGTDWKSQIIEHLNTDQIILLLISADFMASDFCYSVEMTQAIARHDANQARVLPIILRPTDWKGAPFAKLKLLPTDGKAVTRWPTHDDAFEDVVQGIRKAVEELMTKLEARPESKQSQEIVPTKASVQTPIQDNPPKQVQICFISSEYPPHIIGGLGAHVGELTKALGEHVSVNVVLPAIPPESEEQYKHIPGVQLQETGISASYSDAASWINFSRYAAETIRKIEPKPTVIHCHDWVTVLAGIDCRQRLKVPLLFHLHLPNRSPLCASIENLGLVYADLVTVNSQAAWTEITKRNLGIKKIKVIKNGVNVDRFKPCKDWPDDDGYILFVGRLVEQKGAAYLLRAFSYVIEKEEYRDMKLKIVGEGPDREWLETLAKTLLIPKDNVEFLGKKVGLELEELYQKAQMVIIPSIYEPFGMVALEAMACKRPVVASRIGGLSDTIKHKSSGYLAEPKDVLGLSQYMMALMHDTELRQKMGEEGYKIAVSKDYQWSSIAEEFIGFYIELSQILPEKMAEPSQAPKFLDQIKEAVKRLSWGKKSGLALGELDLGEYWQYAKREY